MIISEFLAHQRSKEVLCFVFQPWQDTPSMTCVPLWQVGGGLLDRKLPKLLAYLVSSSIPKKSWLGCHYSHGWSTSKVRSAACGAVVKSWRLSKRQRLWRSQKGIMIVNKRGNGTPNHRKSLCEWLVTWDSGTSPVFLVEGVLAMDPKFRIVPWGLLQIWEMGRPFNLDPGSWNMFHCHQSYTRVSFQCGFLNGVPKLQMLPQERSGPVGDIAFFSREGWIEAHLLWRSLEKRVRLHCIPTISKFSTCIWSIWTRPEEWGIFSDAFRALTIWFQNLSMCFLFGRRRNNVFLSQLLWENTLLLFYSPHIPVLHPIISDFPPQKNHQSMPENPTF